MEKLTLEQMMDLQNVGANLTKEYIFRSYLGWDDATIQEHRDMELRDASQRYKISKTEAEG